MGIPSIAGVLAALVVGGAVGAVAMVGLVNSQTSPPSKSPVNVSQPVIEYGSTN